MKTVVVACGHWWLPVVFRALIKSHASALPRDIAFAALLLQYHMQTLTQTPSLTLTLTITPTLTLTVTLTINRVFFLD